MSPNTLAIRQHTTVVQSVQSATPYRGCLHTLHNFFAAYRSSLCANRANRAIAHIAQLQPQIPQIPQTARFAEDAEREEININHAMVAERSAMVAERHTVIHRQNYRHAGCAKCKPWPLHFCTLNKLEGSRGKPLELVKTLIVIFPIVNFPAQGSQNPNDSALFKRT